MLCRYGRAFLTRHPLIRFPITALSLVASDAESRKREKKAEKAGTAMSFCALSPLILAFTLS